MISNLTRLTTILSLCAARALAAAPVPSVPFDAEILAQFTAAPKITVQLELKPEIDLATLSESARAELDALERANPGSLATPGFVAHVLLRDEIARWSDAWLSFWDLTPRPRVEINRVAFAKLVARGGLWIERIALDPKRCDTTIVQ